MSRPLLGLALLLGVTVLAVWWSGAASGGVSGDAIARFAYLAILAALVGAWAVRMPRQNMLRNAILWTLIILALVVIYGLGGFA